MITFEGPWNNVGIGNHFFIYSYMRLLGDFGNYGLYHVIKVVCNHNNWKKLEY